MQRLFCFALLLLSLSIANKAWASPPPATVAVLPFAKLKGNKTLWLDKAIADLVAQKLAESPDIAVLNRDALQAFLKEMQFQQSGFVESKDGVARVGKIAKTEQVVYGNYAVEGARIAVHLSVMQVSDQKVLGDYSGEGRLSDIVNITEKLADDVLAGRGSKPMNVSFTPTDSMTALEHFYDGIRLYDDGEYEQAMGEFFAATKQDPHYLEAQLWFARMLAQLGKDEQAILAYQQLYAQKPGSIEGIDAQYFAAKLMARTRPKEAVKLFHTLSVIQPEIPETIEAAYEEARLQWSLGKLREAYVLYKQIDDYSEKVRKHLDAFEQKQAGSDASWARTVALEWRRIWLSGADEENQQAKDIKRIAGSLRQSRFFGWEHPLGLYRDAITAMVELYPDLPPPADAKAVAEPPPRGSFIVDPANPVIAGDVKRKETSLFGGDHTFISEWSEMFYALIIPKGYVATGIDLQITGHLPDPNEARDFTLRVMPFPLKENYQNSWLGVIFGQTQTATTLNKHIPFFGRTQKLLALQLVENHGHIDHWQVKLTLAKQTEPAGALLPSAPAVTTDGALLARVRLGDKETRTIRTQPQYIMQWLPKQKLALANNYNDGLWLVGVKGDLLGEETNLWQAHSEDGGKHWSQSEIMTVNSSSLEFAPTLIRREDGGLQLFFLSDRRGLGWELWTSAQDSKTKRWNNPRIVPLRDTAVTGFEDVADLSAAILPYSVMQDNHGVWKVAFYSRVTKKIHIVSSDDLEHWKQTAEIEPQGAVSIALGQDLTGRYYLIDVDSWGKPRVYASNNAVSWKFTSMLPKQYSDPRAIATYPITLLPEKNAVTFVFSDVYTGLQYTRIGPDQVATPDLVTQSALDTYAITATDEGYITAQWKDDDVHIQKFKTLAFLANPQNLTSELIYNENSKDAEGAVWERIFARERYRVPDVTAIAAAAGGRIWWGIETGIMALKDKDFFLADVSDGFFYHFVDQIAHCGDRLWFASSMLAPARVGFNHGREPNRSSLGKSLALPELGGAVTSLTCGMGSTVYFAAASGKILELSESEARRVLALPGNGKSTITSLAYDKRQKRLFVGTHEGLLYSVSDKGDFSEFYRSAHAVKAIAVDAEGNIWFAAEDDWLHVLSGAGKPIRHYAQSEIRVNLHKLVADTRSGIWAASDRYSASPGIMHATLERIKLHNPPQTILREIIDFDVAEDNTLWIGTNLDGIYHYRRAP